MHWLLSKTFINAFILPYNPQVILGIIFPPAILLLDFRTGDNMSYQNTKDKEEIKDKEDDKTNKVKI